jgi:hypothetical protein
VTVTAGEKRKQTLHIKRYLVALERSYQSHDFHHLQEMFVMCAKHYSDRKKLSYNAWREVGVPAEILAKAGIERG